MIFDPLDDVGRGGDVDDIMCRKRMLQQRGIHESAILLALVRLRCCLW
jgi:predicted transglutaminase-like cysteine proteinase